MALVIAEFFQITGIGPAPATLSELIPWLMEVIIGISLVCGVLGMFGVMASLFTNRGKF